MEFRTFIMLNTDIRKSFKKLGVQVLIGLYLLYFSDSIIAQLFPFFNWHFSRSFQNIFVEQGELSATFRKCIYKWKFLWYNRNVGGCWKTALFFMSSGAKRPSCLPLRVAQRREGVEWQPERLSDPERDRAAARQVAGAAWRMSSYSKIFTALPSAHNLPFPSRGGFINFSLVCTLWRKPKSWKSYKRSKQTCGLIASDASVRVRTHRLPSKKIPTSPHAMIFGSNGVPQRD